MGTFVLFTGKSAIYLLIGVGLLAIDERRKNFAEEMLKKHNEEAEVPLPSLVIFDRWKMVIGWPIIMLAEGLLYCTEHYNEYTSRSSAARQKACCSDCSCEEEEPTTEPKG